MKKVKRVGTKVILCAMMAFAGAASALPKGDICNTCVDTIFGWLCWNHPC